jgi:putative addiction module killer protein
VGVVRARLNRIRLGNFGDCKSVGGGVVELRIDFGPGYRVYFGRDGRLVVVLLCGGDKRTQARDILRAREYWKEYLDAKSGREG